MHDLIVAAAIAAVCAAGTPAAAREFLIANAQSKPDLDRLPVFYSSDALYDEFVNDWFMRHLSVDDRGIYLGGGPILGVVDHMWVVEWDCWMLPWIDRGAMGLARQGNYPGDVILNTLANCVVDKYGYVWGSTMHAEPNDSIGGWVPTFGWPWPKYNRNTSAARPTGWEFITLADNARDEWAAKDIALEPGYVDGCLVGKITGPHPELVSPAFDVDVFQVPIIELDIEYRAPTGFRAESFGGDLRIGWTTDKAPEFSGARMVTAQFADLPPKDFAADYARLGTGERARYPLYFPTYLHPEWGREGCRITRLMIVPTAPEGVTVAVNYVRASYDVRLSTSNTTLINAAYRFFMFTGDREFLNTMMPKLRRSMIFLNEHLQGRKEGLLCFDWMVGKDGLGGDEPGHGLIGSYWDLLPAGRYDIESSLEYYYALKAMAELEKVVGGVARSDVRVLGPDNKTMIGYHETPETLTALAARVRQNIEKRF